MIYDEERTSFIGFKAVGTGQHRRRSSHVRLSIAVAAVIFILLHTPLCQHVPFIGRGLACAATAPTTTFSSMPLFPISPSISLALLWRGPYRLPGFYRLYNKKLTAEAVPQLPPHDLPAEANVSIATKPWDNAKSPFLVLGILTTVDTQEKRALIRDVEFARCGQQENGKWVVCKFIIGNQAEPGKLEDLHREQELHGDIVVLDEPENMNEGKSIAYFRWATETYPGAGFVMKADDDVYVLPRNMVDILAGYDPSGLAYFGSCWVSGCHNDWFYGSPFFVGFAYGLSRPLAEWVGRRQLLESFSVAEDVMVGRIVFSLPQHIQRTIKRISLDGRMGLTRWQWYRWDKGTALAIHGLKSIADFRRQVESLEA